jgi:hypothetical protein
MTTTSNQNATAYNPLLGVQEVEMGGRLRQQTPARHFDLVVASLRPLKGQAAHVVRDLEHSSTEAASNSRDIRQLVSREQDESANESRFAGIERTRSLAQKAAAAMGQGLRGESALGFQAFA